MCVCIYISIYLYIYIHMRHYVYIYIYICYIRACLHNGFCLQWTLTFRSNTMGDNENKAGLQVVTSNLSKMVENHMANDEHLCENINYQHTLFSLHEHHAHFRMDFRRSIEIINLLPCLPSRNHPSIYLATSLFLGFLSYIVNFFLWRNLLILLLQSLSFGGYVRTYCCRQYHQHNTNMQRMQGSEVC